ncbi:hypothetical protein NX786_28310 [Telluria mixta]|uniref:ESPR domain-containing protein n=1 Tax=Telluria mixta TaxID=34071 RepID=A0ABT2C7D0_9BURK|nr:hypothetical protein [Telluria mixta]MCS0633246.1 hypothetical protein [Telluria mixta]WEM94729.1 hypothetical protein P0M04_25015 [Telluria mixta]
MQRFTQTVSTLTASASILRRRNRHDTMHLPALPYKQLAASLALAVPMLLASRSGANVVPVRAPLVRVATAPVVHPPAPRAAHTP